MKKILRNIRIAFHAFFLGLRGADAAILSSNGDGTDDNSIVQHIKGGGVLQDLLDEKVTKEVEELRDKNYRILREADKYDASSISMSLDENGEPIFNNTSGLKKKNLADFGHHPPVLEEKDTKIKVIQDNRQINKEGNNIFDRFTKNEDVQEIFDNATLTDFETTLTITRDKFKPRFEIEKYIKKVVVKDIKDRTRMRFDLYCSVYASQFGSVDALFVSELNKLYNNKLENKDFLDVKSISFITDHAFGSEDLKEYEMDNIKFIGVDIFDGNFVLKFEGDRVKYDYDIVKKYETKELTEKYNKKAPKQKDVDLFAAKRKLDSEEINLGTTSLKLK